MRNWSDEDYSEEYSSINDLDYENEDEQETNQLWKEGKKESLHHSRTKRFLNPRLVNTSIVEYLDTGTWYLSIYNDGLGSIQVTKIYFNK